MSQNSSNPEASPLRSVFTTSLTEILSQLNISLVVSTYQAGKVILVRHDASGSVNENGDAVSTINTHFRNFDKPMGIATSGNRLSIGGARTVWEMRNIPDVAQKLDPPGKHDACFLPRSIHITGDIDIHEMAWSNDNELWLVNTRFCCLSTLDVDHSFNPRWRPHFVSALAPEDRCHLNGLAMREGKPRYVTALGKTDTAGGWRANKADGGVLMDVDTNKIISHGLSMPHSPRWYQNELWVLESGQGGLAKVDIATGRWKNIVQLPGFTRGIDFIGPLAFIGLSQVRESATFSGIPLVERLRDRNCGVWVVNIETGQILGFLRFESGVEEIFAVQILHGTRFPEMLEWNDARIANSYVLPDDALADVSLPSESEIADLPATYMQSGLENYRKGELHAAIDAFRECLKREAEFPNARYNLGVVLGETDALDEAVDLLQQVSIKEPERSDVLNSLGHVLSLQHDHFEAIKAYEKAIDLQPNFADAHFSLGTILLQTGDYARGWEEYEWRWKTKEFTPFSCPHPQWDGSTIAESTLLIYTEQGAGDAVQFARYLPHAAKRCAKIILVCSEELSPLFSAIAGIDEIRPPGKLQVNEFDYHIPLLGLPRIFETNLGNIPAEIPYIDGDIIRRRKDTGTLKIPESSRLNIGIVWAGSPTHKNDRHRSCSLTDFLPLLKNPGLSFYSLQKGEPSQELAELPSEILVNNLADQLNDYGDLVVLIAQFDLIITVDTSVAHVAGALGTPVWVLLSDRADWRWGLESDTTPWYPSMRLFRQSTLDDWRELVDRVAQTLPQWTNARI